VALRDLGAVGFDSPRPQVVRTESLERLTEEVAVEKIILGLEAAALLAALVSVFLLASRWWGERGVTLAVGRAALAELREEVRKKNDERIEAFDKLASERGGMETTIAREVKERVDTQLRVLNEERHKAEERAVTAELNLSGLAFDLKAARAMCQEARVSRDAFQERAVAAERRVALTVQLTHWRQAGSELAICGINDGMSFLASENQTTCIQCLRELLKERTAENGRWHKRYETEVAQVALQRARGDRFEQDFLIAREGLESIAKLFTGSSVPESTTIARNVLARLRGEAPAKQVSRDTNMSTRLSQAVPDFVHQERELIKQQIAVQQAQAGASPARCHCLACEASEYRLAQAHDAAQKNGAPF
jgi:hypothetical protein